MGVMRFLVPRRERLAADAWQRAYAAGIDEIPWQCRMQWSGDLLLMERGESDSGNFFIPYKIDGHGELMLSTASLMERHRPYHLQVELARGTVNRLRNQIAQWKSIGVGVAGDVQTLVAKAQEHLSWAVTRQHEAVEAAEHADDATRVALDAMQLASSAYATQWLAARHQNAPKLHTLLGINLGATRPSEALSRQLTTPFNTVQVPFTWRDIEGSQGKRDWQRCDQQIEWCRSKGMKICGGPLLDIDRWSLPDWIYLFGDGDVDSFRACVAEHIQAVVARYKGKVQLWVCAAHLNVDNEFAHDEEERLRMAVLAIETIRRADPRTPVVISIDQPWGSFMSRQECDLSPLHFADALVRAELGLAGLGLEINFGYAPGGSEPRDPLEFGRQLDRWGTLGLPLLVNLTVPSGATPDAQARTNSRPLPYASELSGESQRVWGERYLPVLLAKQPVQGILWNQVLDSEPHALPHGGLFDAQNRPKPIVGLLEKLRREHLT